MPMTRREFLRKSAATAAGIPMASAMLSACRKPTPPPASKFRLARLDNPITYPVDEELIIPDGLAPEDGPLEIFNWEEYLSPRLIKMWEEDSGTKITITTFTNWSDAINRLTTKEQHFDIFMGLDRGYIGRMISEELIRPLNHSYLPNLANVWDSLSGLGADKQAPFYDVGARYSVPYTTFTTGVACPARR